MPEKLGLFHVRVKPTPKYENEFQIDETTFQNVLEDEIRYHGDSAIRNDINSVRSIYVLRQGVSPLRLEDAVAVFVTPNSALAKVAFEQGKLHNSSKEVSSVITDYSLANVAWLKAPMKRPLLPEKETMAFCYAALEPNKELFRKYVAMMDQLRNAGNISEDDHAILRLSPIAQLELMDLTLGDEGALTGKGIKEILSRVKESLVEEQKKNAIEEIKKYENRLEDAEVLLLENMKLQGEHLNIEKTTYERAYLISKIITIIFMVCFSALLLIGGFAGAGLITSNAFNNTPLLKNSIPVLIALVVIWGWYSWLTGKTVNGLTKQLEHMITTKIFTWLTGKTKLPAP